MSDIRSVLTAGISIAIESAVAVTIEDGMPVIYRPGETDGDTWIFLTEWQARKLGELLISLTEKAAPAPSLQTAE